MTSRLLNSIWHGRSAPDGPQRASDLLRHALMRGCVGFVFLWFGLTQVLRPDLFSQFVPGFVDRISPIAGEDLLTIHGALLLTTGVGISLGFYYRWACALGAALLVEIIFSLLINGDEPALIVRDVGILGAVIGLLLDPVRRWHLDAAWRQLRHGKSPALG